VTVAKLPTENFFAAFIIGVIGSTFGENPFRAYFGSGDKAKDSTAGPST
jgi:hypothetical protein